MVLFTKVKSFLVASRLSTFKKSRIFPAFSCSNCPKQSSKAAIDAILQCLDEGIFAAISAFTFEENDMTILPDPAAAGLPKYRPARLPAASEAASPATAGLSKASFTSAHPCERD
jgi:hypothetical protein